MAKFFGSIGYADTVETAPGVWEEQIVEYSYYGDLTRNTRQLQSGETLNDNINVANEISIVADPFARQNFHKMRYHCHSAGHWLERRSADSQGPIFLGGQQPLVFCIWEYRY